MSKARRKFSEEFRRESVRLVVEGKKSITSAAKELGIYQSTLGRWVKQGEVDAGRGPPAALTTDEREELQRLRRETRMLREEREILKKAGPQQNSWVDPLLCVERSMDSVLAGGRSAALAQ